jgi:hypothetical protein
MLRADASAMARSASNTLAARQRCARDTARRRFRSCGCSAALTFGAARLAIDRAIESGPLRR